MAKLLMWLGVLIAIWSLTISGHKSGWYIIGVLAYIAMAWFITFGKYRTLEIEE